MSRKMKDSGVEWIGEIPEDWEITNFKNIIEFKNGYAFNSESLTNDGQYPIIRIGDINNSKVDLINSAKCNIDNEDLNKFLIKKDDILIAMSGATVGKLGYIYDEPPKSFVNQRVGIIRAAKPKYAFYSMSTNLFLQHIYLLSEGSAQPNISTKDINEYKISIPNTQDEQQQIANFLDQKIAEIDHIIDKTKLSIEEYKKYKQSLITETVTKGLNPNVKMKDSGIEWIGDIPDAWKVNKLKYLFDFNTGLTITKSELKKDGIDCLNYGDIHSKYNFDIDLSRDVLPKADKGFILSKPNTLVKNGNFIFCDTSEDLEGSGNFAFIRNSDDKKIFSGSHTVVAKPKAELNSIYIAYLLKSKGVKSQFEQKVSGIKVYSITQGILKEILVILPSLDEQQQIANLLDLKCNEIDTLIFQKEQLLQELESYKKSLIYECVTGKREVN